MKRLTLLPLVAFALAACSDATTSPTGDFTPPGPQFAKAKFTTGGQKKPTATLLFSGALLAEAM